jgi:hypothetical protein
MPRQVLILTIGGFVFFALIGGVARGLHYDFGQNEASALIFIEPTGRPSPAMQPSPITTTRSIYKRNCVVLWRTSAQSIADCIENRTSRSYAPPAVQPSVPTIPETVHAKIASCTITVYANEAAVARMTPAPSPTQFKFYLPQPLWGVQNQILAECPVLWPYPRVSRGIVALPVPGVSDLFPKHRKVAREKKQQFFWGSERVVHFWISPGHTSFYGGLQLASDDPRLKSALGLASLDELAREAFNINFNQHPLYDALRDPMLRLYQSQDRQRIFLTLRGELQPYATIAGASNIGIIVSPIELLRAICLPTPSPPPPSAVASGGLRLRCSDQPSDHYSKIVVQIRGFNVSSFPQFDPSGISQSLGPPSELNSDGSYVWYTSVAASMPQSVQIAVHGSPIAAPTDVHHLLTGKTRVGDIFLQVTVDVFHAFVGVAIVAILLSYAGFWSHDARHQRYCGITLAAATASVLVNVGVWVARYGQYAYLHYLHRTAPSPSPILEKEVSYLLIAFRPPLLAAVAGAMILFGVIVLILLRCNLLQSLRSFTATALSIFVLSFSGSLYSAFELRHHYLAINNAYDLNSYPLTIFSGAALSIVIFTLLMISFRPDLIIDLFEIKTFLRGWIYWGIAAIALLSAVVVFPSSAYFSADYSAPEFRIDVALLEAGNYISSIAVIIPILWFLYVRDRAILKTVDHKGHLALLFAVLVILTGYAYMGFPITLLLFVATIYWIALRAGPAYAEISTKLNAVRKREDLFSEAYDIDNCVAAKQTQERILSQFVSGSLSRADYAKRRAELEAFIGSKKLSVQAGTRAQATELAFGMGLEDDLVSNARLCAFISVVPASVLTLLAAQSLIGNLAGVHVPVLVAFAQFVGSIVGYMAAGLGFGLAYPYLRGKIGTIKALWVLLALSLAILPYEFMSGSRPDYVAQILRWLIFFGVLGISSDLLSLLRWKQRIDVRDFFSMAGLGHFAAVGAVAATIATSLLTSESRDLLELAIHHVVPAQYALPTVQNPGLSP